MDPGFGLKVLLVEDHADIRDALAAILQDEGYEVAAVPSAEAGMSRLQEGRFDLLVTDYCLPERTGCWLVEQARADHRLEGCEVLMITAHPQPKVPSGIQIMRKPLDVDDFVNEVGRTLATRRAEVLEQFRSTIEQQQKTPASSSRRGVELVLYISSSSHSSLRALRNVRKLLERYAPEEVSLTVHDLAHGTVPDAEEDRIAFTPTLVRRMPSPRAWILGDLENTSVVTDLLSLAGLEEKR